MTNSDLFAAFSSRLFPFLYASFPVPEKLPKQQLVDELENESGLWDLKREESTHTGLVEMMEAAGLMTPEIRATASQKQSALAVQIQEKSLKLQRMNAVFDGTVAFLKSEGFIRCEDDGTYQLTLKGFVHLNKRFNQAGIQDGSRYIDQLVGLLRPDKFSGAVASGTLASLLSGIFVG